MNADAEKGKLIGIFTLTLLLLDWLTRCYSLNMLFIRQYSLKESHDQ